MQPVILNTGDGSMRTRIVPMIASAMARTPLLGLDIIGWDYVTVATTNAIMVGFAVAVRGYELAGPGKEMMQFRPFPSWRPTQAEVDAIVSATIAALRAGRDEQARKANGV